MVYAYRASDLALHYPVSCEARYVQPVYAQSLIVYLAAFLSLTSCSDVVTRKYATLDDAR
jgi:hypothetical protein